MSLYKEVSAMLCNQGKVNIKYKPTGTIYTVTEDCKVKVAGEWFDALVYEGSHATFVRLHDDFERFEVVK